MGTLPQHVGTRHNGNEINYVFLHKGWLTYICPEYISFNLAEYDMAAWNNLEKYSWKIKFDKFEHQQVCKEIKRKLIDWLRKNKYES